MNAQNPKSEPRNQKQIQKREKRKIQNSRPQGLSCWSFSARGRGQFSWHGQPAHVVKYSARIALANCAARRYNGAVQIDFSNLSEDLRCASTTPTFPVVLSLA